MLSVTKLFIKTNCYIHDKIIIKDILVRNMSAVPEKKHTCSTCLMCPPIYLFILRQGLENKLNMYFYISAYLLNILHLICTNIQNKLNAGFSNFFSFFQQVTSTLCFVKFVSELQMI